MGAILDLAEEAWNGVTGGNFVHPAAAFGLEPLDGDLAFVAAFANVVAIRTAAGLVLVDASGPFHAAAVLVELRRWSDLPVHTVVVTHGHVDHVSGIGVLDDEARGAGRAPPCVVAHEAVPARFARYALTRGYNAHINQRQFGLPAPIFPGSFRAPDRIFSDRLDLDVGGERVELRHDRGETDDHAWVWLPRHGTVCAGDFFIWALPNCGNPQKAQRYPREWAAALRKMEGLGAERLLPGHGPPILGAARVRLALSETAQLLEDLVGQTLDLMNRGRSLDEILQQVKVDERLLARPYLRPVYDDPEFIVRNVWRLYGGWHDGNPARLKPPPDADLARAVCDIAGGAAALARRAAALAATGQPRVACALAEMAFQVEPGDPLVRETRAAIYRQRADAEPSLMARNLFAAAVRESS